MRTVFAKLCRQIKQKMKNTKTSWRTQSTKKPEGFRVLLKQRYNHNERAETVTPTQTRNLSKSEHINWNETRQGQNYTQMKDYVKKRMRTQHGQISQSQRRRSAMRTPVRMDSKKQSLRNSQVLDRSDNRHSSLSASRAILNQSGRNTPEKDKRSKKAQDKVSIDRSMGGTVSLQYLQSKIVDLLDKRLYQCLENNKKRDSDLQLKLEQIISTLRMLQKEDPETIETDINYLDKKIKLFERLMAQNMTESQIMKNYYMAKLTSRQHRQQRHRTESYTPANQLSLSRYCDTKLRSAVVNSSVAKQVFKPPEKAAYNIYKYTNTFFNADRHKQPLPRSSYNRQYLVNPPSRDKQIVPKDHQFLGKTTSDRFLNSSYQDNFQSKKSEKINIKELDACRDKIRSLAVSFNRPERRSMSPNSYNAFLAKLNQLSPQKKHEPQPLLITKPLLSQSRRQFKKNEKETIESEIKHKNLLKLKHQYLKKFHI